MELDLPAPYTARPYRDAGDHVAMVDILTDYREAIGDPQIATVEGLDVAYGNLVNCDLTRDCAIVEDGAGSPVGYVRTYWEEREDGTRDGISFAPLCGVHRTPELYLALLAGQEAHMRAWPDVSLARLLAFAVHPGPGCPPAGEAAWLESAGYESIRFEALLVRPTLDDIPERQLPDGVEVRPVADEQLRTIFDAHWEAFRGSYDFREATEEDYRQFHDDPLRDVTLWKIAWAGDVVVGQVKSFVNEEENARHGYKRGWTEYISTHAGWRNRGIAGALLAMSLRALRDRGYEQAALGVDTSNPGGAFQLYTALGFELEHYEAVYAKAA